MFYDPETGKRGPDTQAGRLAKWIKTLVQADDLQPNHAWRHRFVTLSRKHQLDQELSALITQHSVPGIRHKYGDVAGLDEQIRKLPYYEVA